jgi:hypothetical protein
VTLIAKAGRVAKVFYPVVEPERLTAGSTES